MKYIQSFYQYPVTFSSTGITIPARSAVGEMKNIAEVTERQLEKLENCEPRFRELVRDKKYRILNKIPQSYVPAAQQINAANEAAERARKENEELKARLAELEKPAKKEEPKAEEKEEVKDVAEEKPASKNKKK